MSSVFRSGAASPSSRYRTALSSRLGFPPPLPLLELDEGEAGVLREVDDARFAACEIDVLNVDVSDRSDVLPAKCANHPLRRVPSAPSARRLGVRARVRSPCPWPEDDDDGGVEAEKWRSERVRGRAVAANPLYALGGLPGAGEDVELRSSESSKAARDSCRVRSSAALGAPRSASLMRCRSRSRSLSLPSPRKRPVLLRPEEEAELLDAEDGGRSTESDLERSRWAGDWRKRGSLDVVGEVGGGGRGGVLEGVWIGGGTILSVVVPDLAAGLEFEEDETPAWALERLDERDLEDGADIPTPDSIREIRSQPGATLSLR
ncbi:hypothetical protein C8F04DRAFT_1123521 [Mycena alexandri]|uniref:Uncharacterized protein n=1 Tax=Mycena alexandri TaxID=1745969 RepID=A0AAD6SGI9_9AGAR|nr:hypothetical protein C8F04DRAFT_1123521 [Mycena alexandri]